MRKGLGTDWPTLNGCGDKAACFASIQDDPAAPVGYAECATGVCYADVEFQKAEPGERLLLVAACYADVEFQKTVPGERLLLETTEPNPGSNCGHWAESQLCGEILSTAAINKGAAVLPAFRGKPRLHVTSVTAGGLEDLGYEWIEPFESIYARRRREASRLRQL
ncbi:hypothetical protein JKP88DRAFT_289288 [Tribonema minus]|uniref:Uncharacterized protein n=1 Tax=Tribonema minus TaxID=303371 RepID=A0A835Z4B1_9STRA|nr:hypothetical protein JKP88DRAFT_289288 [Tribonema minus]